MKYMALTYEVESASDMSIVSGRVRLPAVGMDGRKTYTPVYSAVAVPVLTSARPAADVIRDSFASQRLVDLPTWLHFVESNTWARWASPGSLVYCDAISPNDILRSFGMCMGYYGELVVSGSLRQRFERAGLRYSIDVSCVEGEYFLIEPHLFSDCFSESEKAIDTLVEHVWKIGREFAIKRLMEHGFPCIVMPDSLQILFREDVAKAISETPGFNMYFSFYSQQKLV